MDFSALPLPALLLFGLGVILLALSMLADIYLSIIPHFLLAVASVMAFGWSLEAIIAFVIPHLLFLGVMVIR